MKLIVFYPMICTHKVGCTPFKLWIPPLSFMKRRTDIKRIIHARRCFNIPAKLYKLFCPIYKNCQTKYDKYVLPIWFMKNNCIQNHIKISQRKEIPPNKFQYLFGLIPYLLGRVHDLLLHNHNQDTITLIKHAPNILSKNRALSFQESPALEGGQFHGL